MPAQIVVSGGGGFFSGPAGHALDRYVLSLTGQARPRVCYLATASGDAPEFIRGFHLAFDQSCEATHLPTFLPPFCDPAAALADQHVIYVGGGSTANMLAVWRLHGIDHMLRDALDGGAILYGASAGGLCWFESGVTDSLGFDGELRPMRNGLAFVQGSHCPHFDAPDRSAAYAAMVADGRLGAGLGIDDHAAAHFVDGRLHRVVSAVDGATAHAVRVDGNRDVSFTALPATVLPVTGV